MQFDSAGQIYEKIRKVSNFGKAADVADLKTWHWINLNYWIDNQWMKQ